VSDSLLRKDFFP